MCGIIGYVGSRAAKSLLLSGLERLEYRGYDSAGLALLEDDGLDFVRAVGNLDQLKAAAGSNGSDSTTGVGHTRWATHGRVSEENAHPLTGCVPGRARGRPERDRRELRRAQGAAPRGRPHVHVRDRRRGRRASGRDPLLGRPGGGRAAGVRRARGTLRIRRDPPGAPGSPGRSASSSARSSSGCRTARPSSPRRSPRSSARRSASS